MLKVFHFVQKKYIGANKKKIAEDDSDICTMCLDESKSLMVILECMHTFCINCISRWVQEKKSCPMCKRAVTKNFVLFVQPLREQDQQPKADDDEEFDWTYFPAEVWKNAKFINMENKCMHNTNVGNRVHK